MELIIHNGRPIAINGTRSEERRVELRGNKLVKRPIDITGLRQFALDLGNGVETRTPCGQRKLARRRAKNKVAKQSRKRNR